MEEKDGSLVVRLAAFRVHCEEMIKLGATEVTALGMGAKFPPRPHTVMLKLPTADHDIGPQHFVTKSKLTEEELREAEEEEYVP